MPGEGSGAANGIDGVVVDAPGGDNEAANFVGEVAGRAVGDGRMKDAPEP